MDIKNLNKKQKLWAYVGIGVVVFLLMYNIILRPSNDREWNVDQQVLSYAEFEGDLVNVFNIRNITYRTTSDFDVSYYDKSFNLNDLDSAWFIVEPFSEWAGAAHTFVSFGFGDEFLAVSIEIRKEVGESFSSLKGLFRQYEIMYVLGDEQDLIKLRSNYRHDDVFLYPVNASVENIKKMFVGMIERTNSLYVKPEFYNTLTSTCTTNLVSHINDITRERVPLSFKVLAPGYSDELAYDLGLINTYLPFEEIREYYKINDRAIEFDNDGDFSLKIRGFE